MDDRRRDAAGDGAPSTDAASGAVRDARPVRDVLAMDAVRARVEQALFGAAPRTRLGRYEIVDRIAAGGMGIVYRAEDPELQREVALKVLHPRQGDDPRARQRMLAEARALARMNHPNIVQIHDVLGVDDRVVIVMELVDGATLASWERAQPRSWRELVRVYAQAGEGLAAAHALDIIHRDFKPSNVVIRDNGTVRVLDFGLARFTDAGSDPNAVLGSPERPATDGADGVTATGEIVGTLGYTSPEQLAGHPATPASDQFSFCVALHRALESVPPFHGSDAPALLHSIRAGTITRAADKRVPGWLRTALARGLASEPQARFPSMAALLAELRRPRGWRRWRAPVAAAAVLLATAFGVFAMSSAASVALPACDGGVREIDAVWGASPRARLEATLRGVDSPYVQSIRDRTLRELDAYRRRWIELHRDACARHQRGAQSAALLDRRMSCMARRLGDLRAAVEVVGGSDRTTAGNVLDVVARLPALDECADVDRLQVEAAPPETAVQRAEVAQVRASLARAAALERGARSEQARELAAATAARAEQVAYAPLVAEAALLHGTILLRRGEYAAATAPLSRSRTVALAERLLALAVEAGARQLYVEAMQEGRRADVLRDADVLEPISRSLVGDHFARPLLLNNIASAHMAGGDRATALRWLEQASAALRGVASPDLELTIIDMNIAMLTPDPAERGRHLREVWQRRRDVVGEHHLSTLQSLEIYARFEVSPRVASDLMMTTCAGYDAFYPELIEPRASCHSYRAFLAEYIGDRTAAQAAYTGITRLVSTHPDPEALFWGELASGHARRLQGDAIGAIAAFTPVVNAYDKSSDWWLRYRVGDAELGIGLAELLRGQTVAAQPHLHRAAELYDDAAGHSEKPEFRLRAARARAALAMRPWP